MPICLASAAAQAVFTEVEFQAQELGYNLGDLAFKCNDNRGTDALAA